MEHAAKELAAKKPRQVYKEMVLTDEANAPKDIQQLRDLKHRNEKKTKTTTGNNIVDEVLQVLSMLNDNNFVQKVKHVKGHIPSIILYSEEQIIDFQKFIDHSDSSRVAIDRTFNLGCFYVTSFVYKSHRVVRKDTLDHPIFVGPVFLHKEANFEKYHYFLSHINAKLTNSIDNFDIILPPNIHIGSDDEKTLTKAIDSVFPNSKRSLCTKQMKENVNDYLRNKIGVKTVERLKVMDAIFGEEGILNAEDSYQFEQRSAAASTLMVPLSNEFLQYFNKTLKPKLLINFNNLGTECLYSANRWTNNNAESIHNIMKIDTNWKLQSASSLINILEDMIKLQFLHFGRYDKTTISTFWKI